MQKSAEYSQSCVKKWMRHSRNCSCIPKYGGFPEAKFLAEFFCFEMNLEFFLQKSMTNGLVNFVTIFGWQKLHTWPLFLNT